MSGFGNGGVKCVQTLCGAQNQRPERGIFVLCQGETFAVEEHVSVCVLYMEFRLIDFLLNFDKHGRRSPGTRPAAEGRYISGQLCHGLLLGAGPGHTRRDSLWKRAYSRPRRIPEQRS